MKRYIFLSLVLLAAACSPRITGGFGRAIPEPEWKEYAVKKGRHDFKPNPSILPFRATSFQGWAVLDTSCWYNNLGVDNRDWNKLIGVYNWADFRKNKNSFILAWRPYEGQRDWFEIVLYENINGRNAPQEVEPLVVEAGKPFHYRFQIYDEQYSLFVNETLLGIQANKYMKYDGQTGWADTWFGGNRTAPKPMKVWLSKPLVIKPKLANQWANQP